jgi:hypothetical protein
VTGIDPEAVLSQAPSLAGTPRTITPLPGGLTNRNYKVVTPAGAFVARIWAGPPGGAPGPLAIDRDHEYRNSCLALWGAIQAATSPLDYDFRSWALARFEAAAARFTSPEFPRLLAAAADGD